MKTTLGNFKGEPKVLVCRVHQGVIGVTRVIRVIRTMRVVRVVRIIRIFRAARIVCRCAETKYIEDALRSMIFRFHYVPCFLRCLRSLPDHHAANMTTLTAIKNISTKAKSNDGCPKREKHEPVNDK